MVKIKMLAAFARLRRFFLLLAIAGTGCAILSSVSAVSIFGINCTDSYIALFTVNGDPTAFTMQSPGSGVRPHLCQIHSRELT